MRGQCPVGRSCSHPRSSLAGWDRVCGGCALLPKVYPEPCRDGSLHPRCRAVHAQVCVLSGSSRGPGQEDSEDSRAGL